MLSHHSKLIADTFFFTKSCSINLKLPRNVTFVLKTNHMKTLEQGVKYVQS